MRREEREKKIVDMFSQEIQGSIVELQLESMALERLARYFFPKPCDVFWPSEAGDCRRKIFYERLGQDGKTISLVLGAQTYKQHHQMAIGELIHAGIQHMLLENDQIDVYVEIEKECSYKLDVPAEIRGRADVVWYVGGNTYVEEIKTMEAPSSTWLENKGYPSHIAQVNCYIAMLGAKRGYIVYIPTSASALEALFYVWASAQLTEKGERKNNANYVHPVDFDPELWKKTQNKFIDVYMALNEWKLPDRDRDPLKHPLCNYCPFRHLCIHNKLPRKGTVTTYTEAELAELKAEYDLRKELKEKFPFFFTKDEDQEIVNSFSN